MLGIHLISNGEDYSKDEVYFYEEVYGYSNLTGNKNRFIEYLHGKKDEIKLYCMCQEGKRISLNTNFNWNRERTIKTFYLENADKTSDLHKDDCQFKGCSTELRPSWNKVGDKIEVILPLPKKEVVKEDTEDKEKDEGNTAPTKDGEKPKGRDRGQAQVEKTLSGFLRNLIAEAWDYKTNIEKRVLKFEEFYDFMISYTSKIVVNHKYSLKDILCNKQRVERDKKGNFVRMYDLNKNNGSNFYRQRDVKKVKGTPGYMFVISKLVCIKKSVDNYYELQLSNTHTEENFKYLCKKDILQAAVNENKVKEGPFIVGGYAKYSRDAKGIKLYSIAIVPISSRGVIVESSYEREVYNMLHEENRVFKKPYTSYSAFKNMKVDGILIDTTEKRGTIIEIFGENEQNTVYHLRRKQKIELFSNLKDFGFWYWDAFKNGEEIPPLPAVDKNKHKNTIIK